MAATIRQRQKAAEVLRGGVDPKSSHTSFFLPVGLRRTLEGLAQRHDRSLSAEIRQAIRLYTASGPSGVARSRGLHPPEGSEESVP